MFFELCLNRIFLHFCKICNINCDLQNMQSDCDSISNCDSIPIQCTYQKTMHSIFLQLSTNDVCQDQHYSTKYCCLVLLQTCNISFAKPT